MCGMGHHDGELAWCRAAERAGVLFMVPNLSSKSFEDMCAAPGPRVYWHTAHLSFKKRGGKGGLTGVFKRTQTERDPKANPHTMICAGSSAISDLAALLSSHLPSGDESPLTREFRGSAWPPGAKGRSSSCRSMSTRTGRLCSTRSGPASATASKPSASPVRPTFLT